MKFRKKPVEIEAVQFTNPQYIYASTPKWFLDAFEDGTIRMSEGGDYLQIRTLEDGPNGEAKHVADEGDWIIRGVKGELYACKPDIFEMTYEVAE